MFYDMLLCLHFGRKEALLVTKIQPRQTALANIACYRYVYHFGRKRGLYSLLKYNLHKQPSQTLFATDIPMYLTFLVIRSNITCNTKDSLKHLGAVLCLGVPKLGAGSPNQGVMAPSPCSYSRAVTYTLLLTTLLFFFLAEWPSCQHVDRIGGTWVLPN
jgi:hypothetical protein